MTGKKVIAVTGATGTQGGSLVRAILTRGKDEFIPRAITRNPDSEKAKELKARGAEVVYADMDRPKTLVDAFQGAWGAFCVTNFWEHFSPEKEMAQAKAMAEAAKEANIRHALWSTLEDTRLLVPLTDDRMPTLMGKYKVPHFDAKGEANSFFRNLNVPTTFFHTSFYWDNMIHFGMNPKPGPDGTMLLTLPMAEERLVGIAAEDIGKCALGVFENSEDYLGKTIGVAGDHLTGAQMASILSETMGKPIKYNSVDFKTYRSFGFQGADDLGNMFQYYVEFAPQFSGLRDVEQSRNLNPDLQSFPTWVKRNKDNIPLN